ncbi:MAG TPA: hypothetical protein VFI46_15725, partial [Jiangellaceae bacterium]|nr:hypothetical protein [Jiangellaceae bacterium]
ACTANGQTMISLSAPISLSAVFTFGKVEPGHRAFLPASGRPMALVLGSRRRIQIGVHRRRAGVV